MEESYTSYISIADGHEGAAVLAKYSVKVFPILHLSVILVCMFGG
jgi:hypothetical protein